MHRERLMGFFCVLKERPSCRGRRIWTEPIAQRAALAQFNGVLPIISQGYSDGVVESTDGTANDTLWSTAIEMDKK